MPNVEKKVVEFLNTKFIFKTNFSGDPDRDNFGSDERKVSIIIPSEAHAMELINDGFNVKETKPREGEEEGFVPEYYIKLAINYDSNYPPKIYLKTANAPKVLLDEDSVGMLDTCYIQSVDAYCSIYANPKTGHKSLYVKSMRVIQDISDDPFACED